MATNHPAPDRSGRRETEAAIQSRRLATALSGAPRPGRERKWKSGASPPTDQSRPRTVRTKRRSFAGARDRISTHRKAADAIATYRKLLARFPDTPITPGVRLRLAFALQDNHDAGGAFVELVHLLPNRGEDAGEETSAQAAFKIRLTPARTSFRRAKPIGVRESAVYPNITGANLNQVQEAIDTLLNSRP